MQLIGKNNLKNIDTQNTHSIRITVGQSSKDENQNRKYKFLKPTICIALSILLFFITLYFTCKIYDLDSEIDKHIMRSHKISSNRLKRELSDCPECENDVDKNEYETLQLAVLRCKKNIEKSKDCCELWQKVKELNKVMDDIKKEFNLIDVPCKHKIKSNETEKTGDNKDKSSDSSSSSESKENEENNKKETKKITTIKTTTYDAIYYDDVNEENENNAYENKFSNENYKNAKNKPILQPQYTQNKLYDIYDENFDTKVLDSSEFKNYYPETNIKTVNTNYKPNYNDLSEESTIQKEENKDNTYISNNENKPEYSTTIIEPTQNTKYHLENNNTAENNNYNINEPNEEKNKIYEPQYSYEYEENDKPIYEHKYEDINKENKLNAQVVNDNEYGAHQNLNSISTTTKNPEYKQGSDEAKYNLTIYIKKQKNLDDLDDVTTINNEDEKAATYDINYSKYQEKDKMENADYSKEVNQKLYPYVYSKNKENIPTTTDNQNYEEKIYDINNSNMDNTNYNPKNDNYNPNLSKESGEYTDYKNYNQGYQNYNKDDEFNYEKSNSFISSSPKPSSNINQNKYNDILDYNDHSNRFFGGKIIKINSPTTEKSKITTETQSYHQVNNEKSEENNNYDINIKIKIKEPIVTTAGNYEIYQETTKKQYKSEFSNFNDDLQINKDISQDTTITYDQKPNIDNRIYEENNENAYDTVTPTNNNDDKFYDQQKDVTNEKIYSPEYDDINSDPNNNQQQNYESNEKSSEEDNDYNINMKVNINKNEILPSVPSTTEKVYDAYEENEEYNIDDKYDPDIIKEIINDYGDNFDPETNNEQNIDNLNESQSKSNEFHESKEIYSNNAKNEEIIHNYSYEESNDKNLYETTKADLIINYDDDSPTKETENKQYVEETQNINTEIHSNFNNYYTTQNIETIYPDKQMNNEKSDNYDVRIKVIENNSDFLTSTIRYEQKNEENDDLNIKSNSYDETEVHSAQVYDSYYNSIEDKDKSLDDTKIYKEENQEIKANNKYFDYTTYTSQNNNIYNENEQSNVEKSIEENDYNINYKPKLQDTTTIPYINIKEKNKTFDNDNIYETNEVHSKEIYNTNYNSEKEISVESETYKQVKEEIITTTQNTKLQTFQEKIYYDYDQSSKEKSNEEENYDINVNVKIENNNDGMLYVTSTSSPTKNEDQNINLYELNDKHLNNNVNSYEKTKVQKIENTEFMNSDEGKIYDNEKQIESNYQSSAEEINYDKKIQLSDEKSMKHENYEIAKTDNVQYTTTISYDDIKENKNNDTNYNYKIENNKKIISSDNVNLDEIINYDKNKQTIETRIYNDKSKESLEIYNKNLNFPTQKPKLPASQEEILHYQDKQLSGEKSIENKNYDTASRSKIENNNNYVQHISTTSSYNEKNKDYDTDYNFKYGEFITSDENKQVYKDDSNKPLKENNNNYIYTTQKTNLPASQEEIIHYQDKQLSAEKLIENKNYDSASETTIKNNNNYVQHMSTTSSYNEKNKDYDTDYNFKYGESINSDESQKDFKDDSNKPIKKTDESFVYTTEETNLPASQEKIIHYQDKQLSAEKSLKNKNYDSASETKIEYNNNYVQQISTTSSSYNEQNKDYDTDYNYKYGESITSDENQQVYKDDSNKPIKENNGNVVYTTHKTYLPAFQEEIIHYQDKQLSAEKSIETQKYDTAFKTKIENNNNYIQLISTTSSYNEQNKDYDTDYNYKYGESIYSDENQKVHKYESIYSDENQKVYKYDSKKPIKENEENSIYTTQNTNLPTSQEENIPYQDKQLSEEKLIENKNYDTASKTKIENINNYVQHISTTSSYNGQNKDYNYKYDEIIYSGENQKIHNKPINNNGEKFFYTTQKINLPASQEEIIYEQNKQLNEEQSIENENYVINFKAKIENNNEYPAFITSTVPPKENINNFNADNEEYIYKSSEEKIDKLSTHAPNFNGNIENYSSKININSYIPAEEKNSNEPISENSNKNKLHFNQEENYKFTSTKPEYYINDSEEDNRDDYYKEVNNIMENYDMSYIDEIGNLNNTSKTSYSEEDKFDTDKSDSHENYKINIKYKIDESREDINKYSTTEKTSSPKTEYTSKINIQTIKYSQEQSLENYDNNNEDTKDNYYDEAKNIMENYDMSYIDETGNLNNTLKPYNSEEKYDINIHVNVKEHSDENVHPVVSPYTVSADDVPNLKPPSTHSLNDTTDQYTDKYYQAESKIIYHDYDHNYHDSFNKPHFDKDEPKIEQFQKKFGEHNFGNPSHLNIMIPEIDQNEAITSTTIKPTEYSYDAIDDTAQNSQEYYENYGEDTMISKEDLIQPSVKLNNSESNKYETTTQSKKSIKYFDKNIPSNKFDDNSYNEKETKYLDNYNYNAYDSILQTAENIVQTKEETTKAYYVDSEYTKSFYSNNEPNYNKIDSNSLILSEMDTNNMKTHETNLKTTSTQHSLTTEHYNKHTDTNISTTDKLLTPNLNSTQNNTESEYYPSKTRIEVKHDTTYTKKDSEHKTSKKDSKLLFKEQNKNLSENLQSSNVFLGNEASTQADNITDNLKQGTEEPIFKIDSNLEQNFPNKPIYIKNGSDISNWTDSKNFQTKELTPSSENLQSSNIFLLKNKEQESSTLPDYIKQTTLHTVDDENTNNDNFNQETQDSVLKMEQQFRKEVKNDSEITSSTNDPQFNVQTEVFTPSPENLNQETQEQVLQMNSQFRQDVNDIRIVNQNPIAQRFQNTGSGNMGKGQFDNLFQLSPLESSKASQQLTVNTNMMPLCFYGMPNQNAPAFRQPGYESQISPFSPAHTAYSAFGFPQMYPNNLGNQGMFNSYNNMMAQQRFQSPNFMNHQQNPYFCTYVPSSSLQFPPVTGLSEFRNIKDTKSVLPNDPDDKTLLKELLTPLQSNKSRSSLPCLPGQRSCFDDSKCIKEIQWCDGVIQCNDQSDELGCSCKTRVDKNRLCDGYFDCPNGEDELGCFGCNDNEFSCDDWTERQKKATCVPLDDRCDGRTQCRTGKDEMDCSLLTNAINVYQTYAVSKGSGFLHRNYKGKWYPVCSNTDTWVIEACVAEVGPHATFPIVRMLNVPSEYHGKFLTAIPNKKVEFLNSCMGDVAVYVICPPIPCGTRLLPPPNLFRKHEVDVSAEEDFLPLVSRLRRFTDEIKNTLPYPNLLRSNDLEEQIYDEYYRTNNINSYINDDDKKKYISKGSLKGRDKRGETRVVGGKPSQPTSWPWVVAIYRDGIFHCGGVLMSELYIITAAHCVDTYWQHYYEVQAGMLRRFSFSPMEQNRVVSKIIGHQLYDRTDMKNDLALLKMSQPFQFNRWVRPICLPSESSAGPNWMWGPTPGTVCTAVGWGATIEHGPDPDHMREVEVPILPRCKHREDQEGQEICAGYLEGGRDACQGDSGGPLLCRNPLAPSQWYVAGIVSHGEGCARPNEPGAYTRVSLYINWIATSILDENLPSKEPLQKCPGTLCIGTHRCIPKKRRCDKTIDCLLGDDEIDCPKSDFPSLIKYAMDNMLLFSTNNVTTVEPDDFQSTLQGEEKQQNTTESVENNNESQMETIENDAIKTKKENARKSSDTSNSIITIAKEHTTENDSITSSAFTVDGGQATTMNRNGDISSTFMTPFGEISDVTRTITNIEIAETSKPNQTQSTSIKPSTFITTNDTISESTTSMMSTHATTPVNDVTVTTASRSTTEPTSTVINDSRGALNNNDKNMVDARHKNETSFSEDITTETEKSITEKPNNEKKDSSKIAPDKFLCKKLLQVLPISRRCNRVIDCEDGTDEERCSCKEYLAASYPKAICDGTIDCVDGSDEKNCVDCPDTNFYCHLSGQCIPNFFQCDHKSDCLFGEDEWDCFALTNGSYIRYDKDHRPELRRKGIISVSHAGIWHPLCKSDWFDIAPDVAGDMCIYLGFSGYQKFYETLTIQDSIQTITMDTKSISINPKTNDTCRALYVKCTNSLSDIMDMKKIHTAHQTGANTFKEVFMSPWNAAIFVNGRYTCTGTLVDKEWVITSRKCLDDVFLDISYTTVMLGSGRAHQNVVGPHEQIRRISELKPVTNTDVILLRLYKPVTFTRYVRPLFLKNTKMVVTEKETCIAMGRNTNETMETIFLKPVLTDCIFGERCFKQIPPNYDCNDLTEILPWGGNIVCLSAMGWYVAATFYERKGHCGFKNKSSYTSIRYLTANILAEMNSVEFTVNPPICNGFRCPLGRCLETKQICDGNSNCRDGSDESQDNCQNKLKECEATNTCDCDVSEMRCKNGKCVAKSAFCDRNNDCGDLSDEPPVCNCSSYLQLVAPHRICDGVINCYDKSDENPKICSCHENSFKCGKSDVCIANEAVCDDENDCPNGEDEALCIALKASKHERDGVGEVMLRTYGLWHSYCMPDTPLTSEQLEDICKELNFDTGHAIVLNKTLDSNLAPVIKTNDFPFVKLNRYITQYFRGDYPIAVLNYNTNCKRMYLECT